MSRSLSSLQPLRNIVSRQARPGSSVASRVLAARRTYSTEKEENKEGEAKDENAEKIAGLESKIKELEVSLLRYENGSGGIWLQNTFDGSILSTFSADLTERYHVRPSGGPDDEPSSHR